MKKIKIGVIGSLADKKLHPHLKTLSLHVGKEIAKQGAILLFGYEEDFDSVSTIAAKNAFSLGGEVIAFVRGSQKPKNDFVQIITGQERGGGREFSLILSSDAVICLGGGSGTLMELAIAYQFNLPIVTLKNTGGWSQSLASKYLDQRKRSKIITANSPKKAVSLAIKMIELKK